MYHCLALWLVSALAVDYPMPSVSEEWGKWGLAGMVVAYTLWRDWEREKRMAATILAHDMWVKEQMITAIRDTTTAATAAAAAAAATAAAAAAARHVKEP